MTWYDWLLVATVAGLLTLAALFIGALLHVMREELAEAHRHEREASERLYASWKDGAHIPPAPSVVMPPPNEPLPSVLKEEIEQWSDEEHKAELEMEMRMLLSRGMSPAAILLHLDARHPG